MINTTIRLNVKYSVEQNDQDFEPVPSNESEAPLVPDEVIYSVFMLLKEGNRDFFSFSEDYIKWQVGNDHTPTRGCNYVGIPVPENEGYYLNMDFVSAKVVSFKVTTSPDFSDVLGSI